MDPALLMAAALLGGALLRALEPLTPGRFNPTNTGRPNHYIIPAAIHVLAYSQFWTRARELIGATLTSGYRSPEVNAAVGGVSNSDHTAGLAVDLVPKSAADYWADVRTLRAACERGELGPVRQFIAESYKRVIHLGYHRWGERGAPQYLEQFAPGQHRPLA